MSSPAYFNTTSTRGSLMPKQMKKRARPTAKIVRAAPKSNASIYASILARRVAAEMTPSRAVRKKAAR
jgi:hypothetical protein